MRRLFLAAAVAAILTGCRDAPSAPAAQQISISELQARYNAAFRKYQNTCFHPESPAAISSALHGATVPAPPPSTVDPAACKAAKAEVDSYDATMRAAINAQQAH